MPKRRTIRRVLALGVAVAALLTVYGRSAEPIIMGGDIAFRTVEYPALGTEIPGWPPGLRIAGMWTLESPQTYVSGYSALLAFPDGEFTAFSDRGSALAFVLDDREEPRAFEIKPTPGFGKHNQDIESATMDPATGTVWLGYEDANAIRRIDAGGRGPEVVFPAQMRDWGINSGPEAMVRLQDGRFIVLREIEGNALIFPGDPVEGAVPQELRFLAPEGLHPVDMAQLPDGRVLILARKVGLRFPPYVTALLVADPRTIRPGQDWRAEKLADLSAPLDGGNYEGLAITGGAGAAPLDIWIISDNNMSRLQKTRLVQLRWQAPDTKKGAAARPGAPLR